MDELVQGLIAEAKVQQTRPLQHLSEKQIEDMMKLTETAWEAIAKLTGLDNSITQIEEWMLRDGDHKLTKGIVYIYSMESFIYREINLASRN